MGRMAQSGIVHIEIVADRTHHNLARVQADADLQSQFFGLAESSPIASHLFLHGQSGVTGAHGVILVSQWCPKERHDSVAQHLVNGSFVSVNRIHHDPQYRIDELLRFFWIDALQPAGYTSDVGKENRYLLPFSFQGWS